MNKVFPDAQSAVSDVFSGAQLALGGFGLCGIPEALIQALAERSDLSDLTCVSNNAGVDDFGIGLMLRKKQVKKMISSYVGENKIFEQMLLSGELEVELNPQGTLAERLRAGGAGIPAFYTPTGVGTPIAQGKEIREFQGRKFILEKAIQADFGLIRAWKADDFGNLIFRRTSQNFNPLCAMASRISIVEVEEIVPRGTFDPDHVHLPGVYIQRIVLNKNMQKRIEKIKNS